MISHHILTQIYQNLPFDPTTEQQNTIEHLALLMEAGAHERITIIDGRAGTGKSSIIAAFVKTLVSFNIPVNMIAPTGRAAKVLQQYSGIAAQTIHKRIYRQRSITDNVFNLNFNKDVGAFYIVDEASMISIASSEKMFGSGNLLDDLVDFVHLGRDCRLIVVGDSSQLPPITESRSPALDPHYMGRYGLIDYIALSDVQRQIKSSGVLFNATRVRELIESEQPIIPRFRLGFPDFKALEGADILEEIESSYSNYGVDDTIIITRSNKLAARFNEAIRNRVLYMEEEISSGDMLMVVKNNYFYSDSENNVEFIANGDMFRPKRIRGYNELYGHRFVRATINLNPATDAETECVVMLDTLRSESPSLTQKEQANFFAQVEEDYMDIPRKRDRYQKIRENEFYNALQVKFGYAVTCHKAQGGQWSSVFIDRAIFGDAPMSIDLLRWLYTAITRSSERVYLLAYDERFFEQEQHEQDEFDY